MTLMEGEDGEVQKQNTGKSSIETVERLGKYNSLKNKKKLPKDVFIDKEYSKTIEKECRLLRPILKAARKIKKYKTK